MLPISDAGQPYTKTKELMYQLGITNYTTEDLEILHEVAEVVSQRASYLSAVGLVAIVKRTAEAASLELVDGKRVGDARKIVIGIDGSLYKYHPKFKQYVLEMMGELIPTDLVDHYELKETSDGSGMGAGVIAALSQ